MKKQLIFISFLLLIVLRGTMGQTATNNVQNTATIYGTNSPVTIHALLTSSNVNITGGSISIPNMTVTNDLSVLGKFVISTNNPPVINQILTNGSRRIFVTTTVGGSAGIGTMGAHLISYSGLITNTEDRVLLPALAGNSEFTLQGFIDPSARYIITNIGTTGGGTVFVTNYYTKSF